VDSKAECDQLNLAHETKTKINATANLVQYRFKICEASPEGTRKTMDEVTSLQIQGLATGRVHRLTVGTNRLSVTEERSSSVVGFRLYSPFKPSTFFL